MNVSIAVTRIFNTICITANSTEHTSIASKIENLSKIYDSKAAESMVALRKINFTIKTAKGGLVIG